MPATTDLIDPAPATAPAAAPAPATPLGDLVPRHPLLAATVSGLVVLSLGVLGFTAEGAIAAFACAVLAVLAAVDLEHRLLPNRIIGPALLVVLVARLATDPDQATGWLLAGPAAAVFLAFPLLLRRDAMGLGDIKLAVLLGAIVGWGVFGAIVIGCFAILPVALVMLSRDGSVRGATLPFGPFLAFGTIVVLLLS